MPIDEFYRGFVQDASAKARENASKIYGNGSMKQA
jgi:hypothetical protein